MSKILADGVEFDAQDYLENALPAQPALIEARLKHGHALCMCTRPYRQLVIREVNDVLYLAVWPNDGPHHEPNCEFYRNTDESSEAADSDNSPEKASKTEKPIGRTKLSPVRLNSDGTWNIALDLPKPKGAREVATAPPFLGRALRCWRIRVCWPACQRHVQSPAVHVLAVGQHVDEPMGSRLAA